MGCDNVAFGYFFLRLSTKLVQGLYAVRGGLSADHDSGFAELSSLKEMATKGAASGVAGALPSPASLAVFGSGLCSVLSLDGVLETSLWQWALKPRSSHGLVRGDPGDVRLCSCLGLYLHGDLG